MPGEHELQIALATALRDVERIEGTLASAFEDLRESEKRADAAESERDALRAEVQRLREELEDIAAWNDDQIALIQKEKDRIEDPKGYLHQWEMAHKIAAHDARAALCTGGDRE